MRRSAITSTGLLVGLLALTTPIHAAQPGPDQVPALNIAEATLQGAWTRDGAQLVSTPGAKPAAITLGKAPSDEYILRLSVQRAGGAGGLTIGFACGVTRADAVIDGWNGSTSGLSSIAGKPGNDNPSAKPGEWLASSTWTPLTLRVTASGITLTSDGREVIAWKGDPSLLSSPSALVTDRQRVYLLAGDEQTSIRVKDVRFEALTASESRPKAPRTISNGPAAAPEPSLPTVGSKWKGTRTDGQDSVNVNAKVVAASEDRLELNVTDSKQAVWSWVFKRQHNTLTLLSVEHEKGRARDIAITNARGSGTFTNDSIKIEYRWQKSRNRGVKNQNESGHLTLHPD